MVDKELLIECSKSIMNNINKQGFARYDPSNVRMMDRINKTGIGYSIVRKIAGIAEIISPIGTRLLLRVTKNVYPTAYTHVINSILTSESTGLDLGSVKDAKQLFEEFYVNYTKETSDDLYWLYPRGLHTGSSFPQSQLCKSQVKTLSMHVLARIGIVMARLYEKDHDSVILDRNLKTIATTLRQHLVYVDSEKCGYISYFPNTNDCTLNVNTEFAQWVTMLPKQKLPETAINLRDAILRMMVKEQNDDGSWYYLGKDFANKIGAKHSIDCHHTGTVLFNLINTVNYNTCENEVISDVKHAIDKGMKFYVDRFFCKATGLGYIYLNGRKAGAVQYSEAICAFSEYIKSEWANEKLKQELRLLIPKVMQQCVDLVDIHSGKTPSEHLLFRWVEYDSIRWGNGPVLEAICRYLNLEQHGYLEE